MDKTAVRTAGRTARRAISGPTRANAERLILTHLLSLPTIRRAHMIGVFVAHDGEPDQAQFVARLREFDMAVALPTVADQRNDGSADGSDASDGELRREVAMRYLEWAPDDELVSGRFDIPVPAAGRVVTPDVVLVPFTGFDATGNRIGRGRGFFDHFLATFVGRAVGVGFEAQRFDRVPVGDTDVALRTIVTDLGVRHIGGSDRP